MEQFNKQWFLDHKWHVKEYENGDIIAMITKNEYGDENYKLARVDYRAPQEKGDEGFFLFYASGDGFQVKNNISKRMFTEKEILSALDVIGFND